MAKYIEDFNSKLDWAMPFQRTGKFPIDRSCMFESYTDAVAYAKGDGSDSRALGKTSYIGQLIVVFENDIVTVYKINADRTIEALTSSTGVDADILDLQNQINTEITARKALVGQTGQTYAANTSSTHIKSATSLNDADIKLSAALDTEIAARKAIDGQTGQTYAANTGSTHIKSATSLNDADVKLSAALDTEIAARQKAINDLDATVTDDNTHVDITIVQTDGKLTSVNITETDIASASALTAEIAARKAVDGQTGQTYAANTASTYISAASSLNDADVKLSAAISNLKITSVTGTELSGLGTNVKEAYKLIDGNSTKHGDYIKIYKDSSLQEVYLGLSSDTINTTTGVITKNTVPSGQTAQSLNFKYQLTDGTYSLVKVDVSSFLAETEYADGLQVNNHIISVKRDSTSESFLTVSSDGIKLSGVQNAINTAINNLDVTNLSGASTNVTVKLNQVDGKISGLTVTQSDIASATALTAEIAARKAVDGQTGQTYVANSSASTTYISAATSLNDADVKLDNAVKAVNTRINNLDATLSAASTNVTVKLNQTDGKISGLTVTQSDIASATALSNEITNRGTAITNAVKALSGTTSGSSTHVGVKVVQSEGKISSVTVTESDIASASALTALSNWCSYMSGHTTSSNVTSIPTTKRLCLATISSSQTLGVNGTIPDGREVHIIVKNNSSSKITITIPTSMVNIIGDNIEIDPNGYAEMNVVAIGSTLYFRGAGA